MEFVVSRDASVPAKGSLGGGSWETAAMLGLRPGLPLCLAAPHPAGVRKGTPWYFLTPSYWTGRGSGRAGSRNVVRTARWVGRGGDGAAIVSGTQL